jgi:hypothetical protein
MAPMVDDRRRAAGPARPSAEPGPTDTLPYAVTLAPKAQGSRPPEMAVAPQGSTIGPPRPGAAAGLPAGSLAAQLAGATLDMLPAPPGGGRRGDPSLDDTLELAGGDRGLGPLSLEPGQQIGHFVIRKRLGEGGMGVVLACEDTDLGRPVAIKLVRAEADRPAYRARLLREAQAMARLEHPNVVRVYEIGNERGRLFVAMELVDGITLTAWLAGPRRPWREVVAMFAQIGAGLAAVHRAGLIHRDFKPDNVLIDREGRARVADLGLARLDPEQAASGAAPALAVSITRSGMTMGTPGYMAPEQQAGVPVDARADQYGYCIALREALLGGRIVRIDRATWRHVPRALRAIVERGLAFEPGERFASMDALLDALRRVERRRGAAVSVAVAAIAIAAGIATTAALMTRDRGGAPGPAPPPAGVPGAPAGPAPAP